MITDVGGVNDRSFNQTSWEGLQALAEENPNIKVSYLESSYPAVAVAVLCTTSRPAAGFGSPAAVRAASRVRVTV